MSDGKPSPGPWHASRKSVFVNDINNRIVAEIGDKPQREANARLIAASPDMLAALKRAVALADAQLIKFDGRTPECEKSYLACKAAIAKAEGRGDEP